MCAGGQFPFQQQGAQHCCPPRCAVAGTSLGKLGLELNVLTDPVAAEGL